jgi:V/A-type H+-transporting ATPase subunit F
MPLPAVISLPGQGGSTGYGMNNIRSAVERAVGADILFKE